MLSTSTPFRKPQLYQWIQHCNRKTIDKNFDFIWLVNNDVIVAPGTSVRLLAFMDNHERYGVVSPVIRASDDNNSVEACVNKFNWASRTFSRATDVAEGERMQSESATLIWVAGTAALYRVSALQEIGLLDEPMFAYFDDPDVRARLATRGWTSRCAFDTAVVHESKGKFKNLPLYCFYLPQRNEMRFWIKNMPRSGRKLLWIKVLDTAFFEVNRLYRNGLIAQGDAALLGIAAFLQQRFGAPVLNREVVYAIRLACKLSQFIHRKKLRFYRPAID